MTKPSRRILLGIIAVAFLLASFFGYKVYSYSLVPNCPITLKNNILLVPHGSTLETIIDSLQTNEQIINAKHFRWTANRMAFDDTNIHPGRYVIPARGSNRQIISLLRGGNQTPLQVTIQNVR